MLTQENKLLKEVADYYGGKLLQHGETAKGVDWNGESSQHARFEELCRLINGAATFSVNDLGCGYGAMKDFLRQRYGDMFNYCGIDVSAEMIAAAQRRHDGDARARFVCMGAPDQTADFGIASGIFNVRQQRPDAEWREYIENTLDELDRTSLRGFAFNCLTSYSDEEKKRSHLFYADPLYFFDLCKRRYSRNVALLHDYELYEFTILVKKQA